jgi:hypothetical protein
VAAIWNKRLFEGDFSLEFSAAFKMKPGSGGSYEDAADLNATVCADGRDLTSGYSFLLGGKNNSGTYIARQNRIVAECPIRIPRQLIHRRWFNIQVQKRGNHLTYWIDRRKVLEYVDPEPLTGPYLALWTRNNGFMVTRVRVSSLSGKLLETPDPARPSVARCFYDIEE